MAEDRPWSPFGEIANRLPAVRAGVSLAVAIHPAAWLLQADATDLAWREAVEAAAGLAPPLAVGEIRRSGPRRILCLGPDLWLLLAEDQLAHAAVTAMQALGDRFGHASAVEQTDARVWAALDGEEAVNVLARLTTFDLALSAFPAETGRGARLGPLACVIERPARDRFIIAGPVSTAAFMAMLLLDALPNE